jgi:hypothetical protein
MRFSSITPGRFHLTVLVLSIFPALILAVMANSLLPLLHGNLLEREDAAYLLVGALFAVLWSYFMFKLEKVPYEILIPPEGNTLVLKTLIGRKRLRAQEIIAFRWQQRTQSDDFGSETVWVPILVTTSGQFPLGGFDLAPLIRAVGTLNPSIEVGRGDWEQNKAW